MFYPMRRARQALSMEECDAILRSATSGVLAVYDGEYPYTVPLSYVWDGKTIAFHGAMSGHKLDAIRKNDHVSFCVIGQDDVRPELYSTLFKSVIVFGRARIVEDEKERLDAVIRLAQRYRPGFESDMQKEIDRDFPSTCVIEITPEHITGKQSMRLLKEQ